MLTEYCSHSLNSAPKVVANELDVLLAASRACHLMPSAVVAEEAAVDRAPLRVGNLEAVYLVKDFDCHRQGS